MSLWLFWTIAAVLFLGAIGLLYWGLWGDRSKGRLRCPKCWYDMSGSFDAGKLECPECGKDAGVERGLRKNRRNWWVMVVAVVLVLPHFYASYIWYGWLRDSEAAIPYMKFDGVIGKESIIHERSLPWIPQPLHLYCDRVYEVALGGTDVADADMVHFKDLAYLRDIYLGDHVTDDGLVHLKEMHQLRFLALNFMSITDKGLFHLRGLVQLEDLSLGETLVTDDGLVHLSRMTQLRTLSLSDTQVTDKGLSHLSGLKHLEELYLDGTQITDAGLVHIGEILQMKTVDVRHTKVTAKGVEDLREVIPNCKIFRGTPFR